MEATHELRLYDYRKGLNHSELLKSGNEDECYDKLKDIAAEYKCGIGLLLNNVGYRIVNLEEERINYIKLAAIELYEASQMALEYLNKQPLNDEGDQARQYLELAIFKADDKDQQTLTKL